MRKFSSYFLVNYFKDTNQAFKVNMDYFQMKLGIKKPFIVENKLPPVSKKNNIEILDYVNFKKKLASEVQMGVKELGRLSVKDMRLVHKKSIIDKFFEDENDKKDKNEVERNENKKVFFSVNKGKGEKKRDDRSDKSIRSDIVNLIISLM